MVELEKPSTPPPTWSPMPKGGVVVIGSDDEAVTVGAGSPGLLTGGGAGSVCTTGAGAFITAGAAAVAATAWWAGASRSSEVPVGRGDPGRLGDGMVGTGGGGTIGGVVVEGELFEGVVVDGVAGEDGLVVDGPITGAELGVATPEEGALPVPVVVVLSGTVIGGKLVPVVVPVAPEVVPKLPLPVEVLP
jgi:hypothetical protein